MGVTDSHEASHEASHEKMDQGYGGRLPVKMKQEIKKYLFKNIKKVYLILDYSGELHYEAIWLGKFQG